MQAVTKPHGIAAINGDNIDPKVLDLIPSDYAYQHQVFPIKVEDGVLIVALANLSDPGILEDLRILSGLQVSVAIRDPAEVRRLIERFYVGRMLQDATGQDIEVLENHDEEIGDPQAMAREAFTVKLVNLIFQQAVQERASDIHIEPFERELKVRYRIDGVLHEVSAPPKRYQAAIASRIKIMAQLNIAERRLPQDGRIKIRTSGRDIDVRVSFVPTIHGESIVMRLLDKSSILMGLGDLGMEPGVLKIHSALIRKPFGIFLVTGPTGSGKTTTLYGSLNEIYSPEKKIITIEDPVEYQLDGVNQIPVRPKVGLTFANGLRSILRQDPDIIMVGEIRDLETAEIAIQASLTGHLVLSTLHTNDAAGAITRLLDMGIEPYLVASSVEGILAQRLVRRICSFCKEPYEPARDALEKLGPEALEVGANVFYRGRGCPECKFTGYRGRMGIFELLVTTQRVRSLILARTSSDEIKREAREAGMVTLREDGFGKAVAGITTIDEVFRVTELDDIALDDGEDG